MVGLNSDQEKFLDKLENTVGNIPCFRIMQIDKGFRLLKGAYIKDNNINMLALHNCRLNYFPDDLCNIKSLKRLYLFNNKIPEIPESIGSLSSLEVFHLQNNELKNLPEAMGDLNSLKKLILKENKIENLPNSLGNLINLEKLDLTDNELMRLPESFSNLKMLKELKLNNNKFNNLPYSIWSVINNLEEIEWEENPWNEETLPILKRDLPAIADFCRERASIRVFLCHKYEEYAYFKIKQIAENLEHKDEVYEVHYCQKDPIKDINKYMEETISKCQILVFFASKKSMKSNDCIIELKYAQNKKIAIIPIIKESDELAYDNLENFGTDKKRINLGRPIGFFYDGKDIESLCKNLYIQLKKIKRTPDFFDRDIDSDLELQKKKDLDYFYLNEESFPKLSLAEYEKKTGKIAVWRGKFTKGFKNWFTENYNKKKDI